VRWTLVSGCLALGLALGGCSVYVASSPSSSPIAEASRHLAFVRRANAICARHNAEDRSIVAGAERRIVRTPTGEIRVFKGKLEQQASVARTVNRVGYEEVKALRQLPLIPGDRPAVSAILASMTEALGLGEESIHLTLTHPAQASTIDTRATQLLAVANGRAAAFGLTTCAE
jgi:hypothetical protein